MTSTDRTASGTTAHPAPGGTRSSPGGTGPARVRRRARRLRTAAGILLAVVAVGVLSVGGFAATIRHDDGYLDLGHAAYRSDAHAVVTEPYDWSTATFLTGEMGKVRIQVTGSGDRPTFVGLATPAAARRYLHGVGYTVGHPATNYHVTYTRHAGSAPGTPPGRAPVWEAQATGTGTLTLDFPADKHRGDLVLVAMNADGSAHLAGRVRTFATVPSLSWIATFTLAGGVVLLAGAVALIVTARRRHPTPRTGTAG